MIYLATDHAGFELKEAVKRFLDRENFQIEDCGAHTVNADDDYPDFILAAAQKVAEDPKNNRAIIFGGSGQGEAITANKVRGIRAALYYGGDKNIITLSREHNDANILALGARFLEETEACEVVKLWLTTPFPDEERHARRIEKITAFEKSE